MRLTILAVAAAILLPAALTAHAGAPAKSGATDFSSAKGKAQKKPPKKKDEYLKAAPGAGPSGPATKY